MSDVSVSKLARGMIVDSDVFSKRGSLLLYKGFKIENPDLVSIVLKRNGINTISVKDEDNTYISVSESDKISQRVKQEVTAFKEEFSKIVENLEEDIEKFSQTKDISQIRELDRGAHLAEETEKSILTIFQLVEKIKNEGTDKYSDILQISLISYSIGKWINLDDVELKHLSEAAMLSGIFILNDITYEDKPEIRGKDTIHKQVLEASLLTRERVDGSGPMGLKGEIIPLYARIIAIAEIFYNLTNQSEFYEKISVFDALKVMQAEYMGLLDPKMLYIFLHKVANKYIGSTIRLSDGTSGIIVFVPENEVSLPFIKTADGRVINLQSDMYKSNKIIEII